MNSINNDENNISRIRTILYKYKATTAFLIGNGIHYQYKDCNIPWKKLLEDLWTEYTGKQEEIPAGISFTEFYDIIELITLRPNISYEDRLKRIANEIKDKKIDVSAYKKMLDFAFKLPPAKFDINNINRGQIDQFNNANKEYLATCRNICTQNYENTDSLSDQECAQIVMGLFTNRAKQQILKNSIKKNVASRFPDKQKYNLSALITKIKEFESPILTTNFDVYIGKSIMAKRRILSPNRDQYKFTDFYPWNVYYGTEEIENPLDGFGIWHINGLTDYPRSIRLGLSDYMGCVERARKMIQSNGFNELFDGKNQYNWIGGNTWLHVIFNRDLFIFGLALEENEVFLRWLLIQRAKYGQMYNIRLKGWYIGNKLSDGKKFFLEQLGFDVIEISDFNNLYQCFAEI